MSLLPPLIYSGNPDPPWREARRRHHPPPDCDRNPVIAYQF
ncbi:hypothetical protein MtrunA17_Chr7g0233451 [Medicago truncatula]|uniref:Uncharacterized protein n=1 Tax=Medicago truncatula TaxID=3880 RepID=A0A396GZI5_MEDTR|nr:hypothetical protein MtrunA17_Chr7g0233451 [Medicago truncatula]